MNYSWIKNYTGIWADDEGRKLIITPYDDENATVDLLVNEVPMVRPWCDGKPAVDSHNKWNRILTLD